MEWTPFVFILIIVLILKYNYKIIKKYKLNHIGYVVSDLKQSAELFKSAFAYKIDSNEIIDNKQDVTVQFLSHLSLPRIELITPNSKDSPVQNALSKGGGINHTCYEVTSIHEEIKILEDKSFRLVSKPVPGAGHNNRLICFLYSARIGLIELVEKGN